MLAPTAVVETADNNTARGGGVSKKTILEVDADVGNSPVAVGAEEHEVSLAQVFKVDHAAVLLEHLGRIAVNLDTIDRQIDFHHHS